MTITATARRHVVNAVREALRVNDRHARDILETVRNENSLHLLGATDMRTVKALVINCDTSCPRLELFVDDGRGYESTGVSLRISTDDMKRWSALSIEDAYEIAAHIHENRGQGMIDADDRLAAEMAEEALAEDDFDLDALMGPVPEPRDWKWVDGTVVRADVASSGDHVVALVELADGTRQTMAMLALFGTPAEQAQFAQDKIGTPARLNVGRVNMFDQGEDLPAGFDRSMPLLDMIIPQKEVPALVRSMRRAA